MGLWNWLTGSKDKKRKEDLYQQTLAAIQKSAKPEENQAQNFLTTSAIDAANVFKSGDYSQLPKGMFFDFKNPIEEMKTFDNVQNLGQEGTYALGDNQGAGNAMALAGDYRKNMFARQSANNYQDNVRNASTNVQGALQQAAGAKGATDANTISALSSLYSKVPEGNSNNLMNLINTGLKVASAAGL